MRFCDKDAMRSDERVACEGPGDGRTVDDTVGREGWNTAWGFTVKLPAGGKIEYKTRLRGP